MNERELFESALEISDPAERDAYLDQVCGQDASLRNRLAALLASHENASQFLNVPLVEQLKPPTNDDTQPTVELSRTGVQRGGNRGDANVPVDLNFLQPSSRPESIGRLGHYEVLQVLGQGAFGIVFKAFDEKLQRLVAIKAMNPHLAATSPPRKRFLREARSAAAIKHENIVQVYSVEEQPLPYLVMEYIDGPTLQQKLDDSGPLETSELLYLGQQIAVGLAAAHAMDLIHRDIKPGNILIEQGAQQRVKITDFGLARATDDASLTQSGVIAGTPMFMAPEQALGQTLDHRADLFSLGSVLYQMACGHPPFRASSAVAVLRRVVEDTPRPLQEVWASIPDWLCAIINKLLAKHVEDRFQTAQEVADLLGRCLADLRDARPVTLPAELALRATTSNPPELATKPAKSPGLKRSSTAGRGWFSIAAAVLLVLGGGLGLTEATGISNFRKTVIRLFSADGTLVVEVDDPEVSVTIDGEEMVITGTGAKEIRLQPGHYKVLASKDGKLLNKELVTVTKNGRQVVRLSHEAEPAAPTTSGISHQADRRAAEWVLSVGGKLKVNDQDEFADALSLPTVPFRLTYVGLGDNVQVTDSDIAILKDCEHLAAIGLENTNVSDAGLMHLKNLRPLTHLYLQGSAVSDVGLAYFKDCSNLLSLGLGETLISDASLQIIAGLNKLQVVDLTETRVTKQGIEKLQRTRPNCKIIWDGGVIEPQGTASLPSDKASPASCDYDELATGRWTQVLTRPGETVECRNATLRDGVIEIQNGHAYDKSIKAADVIMRAKVQKLRGQNVLLTLRDVLGVYYSAVYQFDGVERFGVGTRDARFRYSVKQHFESSVDAKEGDFFELAFSAVGNTLTVYANGKGVGEFHDSSITRPGGVAVHATKGKGVFKDVEVMVLGKPAP